MPKPYKSKKEIGKESINYNLKIIQDKFEAICKMLIIIITILLALFLVSSFLMAYTINLIEGLKCQY